MLRDQAWVKPERPHTGGKAGGKAGGSSHVGNAHEIPRDAPREFVRARSTETDATSIGKKGRGQGRHLAGGKTGGKAGGKAGSKAGGKAGSKAGGKAGSSLQAGNTHEIQRGVPQEPGRVYNDVGAASETDATSGRKKKKKGQKPKCGFCEKLIHKQCGNWRCQGFACDSHLQHRWLNGRVSRRRYCPNCKEGPVQHYFGGPLLGHPEAAAYLYDQLRAR